MKRPVLLLTASLWLHGATAGPAAACSPAAADAVEAVNRIRAAARSCGQAQAAAAAPLSWDGRLAESAERYAAELAQRGELSHRGLVAATLRQRLADVQYPMARAAENLGGGPETLAQALQLWLASPPHCANLMAPDLVHLGVACVRDEPSDRVYWVMHLAAPVVRSSPGRSP
jgi:uncharacterized protein YkwD